MDAACFARRWWWLGALLAAALPFPAGAQQVPEAELKAAILANMLHFVDWPAGAPAADQLTFCFIGKSPVADALLRLNGRSLKNRVLSVQPLDANRPPACHAVYFSPDDAAALDTFAAASGGRGILLAGDSPGYLQRGAMLNLELSGGRVVFDVDLRAARGAGLAMSSKALRLARRVSE